MFMVKCKQRDIQKRIVIALALLCLVVCAVNVQLYLEHQIVAHTVTCTSKLNQQGDFFDMSVNELMKVMVTSRS
jgi:ATP/ADP translocase